jgi:hypothetical protein
VRGPDGDPTPTAPACSGPWLPARAETWPRCVDGRPISGRTTRYLAGRVAKAAALGKRTLALVWEHAGRRVGTEVSGWIRAPERHAQRPRCGARPIPGRLPTERPWPNPTEPKWVHGQRRVVEPGRPLSRDEPEERGCADFGCPRLHHPAIPNNVR